MTRTVLTVGFVALGSLVVSAQSLMLHPLDDAGVQAAIDAAADEDYRKDLSRSCGAGPGFGERLGANLVGGTNYTGGYRVTFASHFGQIAMAVADRESKYMPPPMPEDISDDLRQPALSLWIEPTGDTNSTDNTTDLSASITHVVIRPEDREAGTIQPLELSTEPVSFQNLFGAEFVSTRALATFPADSALEASADRDLEVVIITPAGERKCNVDNDRIYRMFHLERPN